MLKVLVFNCFSYLWAMYRKTCPICGNKNLRDADHRASKGITVCENEHYKHVVSGHTHFLIRTKRNRIEELNLHLVTN